MLKYLLLSMLPGVLSDTVKSTTVCRTKQGNTSIAPVPTSSTSVTTTLNAKRTVTSYPTVTVTPSTTRTIKQKSIIYQTTKTTTVPPPAGVATATEWFTEIYSDRVYADPTITITETSEVPFTTTLGVPADFTPIKEDPIMISAFGGPIPKAKRDVPALPYAPRAHLQARQATQTPIIGGSLQNGQVKLSPPQYPQSVTCTLSVRSYVTSTSTVPGTVTRSVKLPTPSTTTTTTVTSKVIATVYGTVAGSTTTTTLTTTSSYTETLDPGPTTVQVTTTNGFLPVATAYAMCQENNMLMNGPQGSIGGWAFLSTGVNLQFSYLAYGSPEECCAECARRGCTEWAHIFGMGCWAAVPYNGHANGVFFDSPVGNAVGVFGNGAANNWGYGGDVSWQQSHVICDPDGCYLVRDPVA